MCKGTKNVPTSQNEVHKVSIATEARFYLHIMELNGHACHIAYNYFKKSRKSETTRLFKFANFMFLAFL